MLLYDTLLQMAQGMNEENAIAVLTRNLNEEISMAGWIKTNTPEMITQLWPEIEASFAMSGEEAQELQ